MVTIFELFALLFLVLIPILIGKLLAKNYGTGIGTGTGIVSALVCITIIVLLYRARGRRHEQRQRRVRDKYRGVYRVIGLPTDPAKVRKPEGAEIKIGDYGWEAEPICDDGLIYLQGLTGEWRVVWYAGFRPDQLESVGPKPRSQYDWQYSWVRNPPPCPYPVQQRETPSMGLPMVMSGHS
jgi:hypothetical protein